MGPLSLLVGPLAVVLVLALGLRPAVQAVLVAAAALATVAVLSGQGTGALAVPLVLQCLLPLALAALLAKTRSLTLVLQVLVIAGAFGILTFFAVVGDATGYWEKEFVELAAYMREHGGAEYAPSIDAIRPLLASQMTMLVAFLGWLLAVAMLLGGLALYRCLPGERQEFGAFRNLDYGRVLAVLLAASLAAAMLTGAAWLQAVAEFVFATFFLQGLAIVHWLKAERMLPTAATAIAYVLLALVSWIAVAGLALTGYIDAWFRLRWIGQPRR